MIQNTETDMRKFSGLGNAVRRLRKQCVPVTLEALEKATEVRPTQNGVNHDVLVRFFNRNVRPFRMGKAELKHRLYLQEKYAGRRTKTGKLARPMSPHEAKAFADRMKRGREARAQKPATYVHLTVASMEVRAPA